MPEEGTLLPTGLSNTTMILLVELVDQHVSESVDTLLGRAREHLAAVRLTAAENPFINLRLAEAICDRLHLVATHWDRIPSHARPWLKAAIVYFEADDDEISDSASPIGFEDDCEVLNACLELAGRVDLKLNPEDFDDF